MNFANICRFSKLELHAVKSRRCHDSLHEYALTARRWRSADSVKLEGDDFPLSPRSYAFTCVVYILSSSWLHWKSTALKNLNKKDCKLLSLCLQSKIVTSVYSTEIHSGSCREYSMLYLVMEICKTHMAGKFKYCKFSLIWKGDHMLVTPSLNQ